MTKQAWGPWSLRQSTRELVCRVDGRELYAVDLDRCATAAAVLDWLCQMAWKTWATPEVVGHLVKAVNDTVNPQAGLCAWGMTNSAPLRTNRTTARGRT